MIKWKLMLTTLPYVLAVWGVKLGLRYLGGFEGLVDFGDVSVVLTAGVFLTGFLLTGTMADYKEAEKLPGELATTLETIEEQLVQSATQRSLPTPPIRKAVLELADAVKTWLIKGGAAPFVALTSFSTVLQRLELDGVASAGKVVTELHSLRKTCTRISVISRTGFLPPAYALLETLLAIIIVLVLAAKYKTTLAETILVPFVTLIYIYMLRLIRDIDDPFEYAEDGSMQGGAEVALFPLDEYRERLKARL